MPPKSSHLPAVLTCLAAAFLVATLPHWLALSQGHLPIWVADHDEMFYLAIAGQAYDNHPWTLTEPMIVHGLQNPYPWIQLAPGILLAKLGGFGPLYIGLMWRAMGALFIGLCYYLLTYATTRSKAVATALTVWICADVGIFYSVPLGRQLLLVGKFLTGRGQELLRSYPQIEPSWRIVTPTLSLGFLLLFHWLLGRAREQPIRRNIALAGMACGLLFYDYFYFIVAAGVGLIFNLVIDRRHRRTYFLVGAIGCLCGLPYFIAELNLKGATSGDWLQRWDMFVVIPRTSELLIPKTAILASAVMLVWCFVRAQHLLYLWVFAFSALLLLNHQLFTGLQIQNYHWIYVLGPMHALLLAALVWHEARTPKRQHYVKACLYTLTPFIFLSSLWLRSIEARRTTESQALLGDLEHYKAMRLSPAGKDLPLPANALIAGRQDFVEWASVLENQRPLLHYTVISSPSIDDREWDERAALNGFLQGIARAAFIAEQTRDLAINAPRSAAVRASRLAGRLAAYDLISADLKPALTRLPVRYVAVKAGGMPAAFSAKIGLQIYQASPTWELWRLP